MTEVNKQVYERVPLIDSKEEPPTFYVYALVLCVCISGFLFGYDTGIISGALQPLEMDFIMSTQQKEWIVGSTTFGAIFGGFFAGMPLIVCASIIFIMGSLLLALASSYITLISGRLVVGVGVGIASMITPVYITTMNTLIVTLGQVIAYIVNIIYADTRQGWRIMFGLGACPALIQLIMLPWMPESPRRMVARNDVVGARRVLKKIYPIAEDEVIEDEIRSIQKDVIESTKGKYSDFKQSQYARPLLIACILQAAQQLSGFNTAMYYAATILKMAGFRNHQDSTTVALIVAITNMVFTFIAVLIIDRVGRRRILILTMLSMIVCLIALGASFAIQQGGLIPRQEDCAAYTCARCVLDDRCDWSEDNIITLCLLLSLGAYVGSYALGLGYVPWVIQSEIFTLNLRGKANGIATAVNWTGNLIVSSTFLSTTNVLSAAGTFWLYATISLVLWIILVRILPETSGKSLEELSVLFTNSIN
ncbi:general substrate transporter [Pilobolus umbonatus]|nr:general substrate transporter [Pilobolus umbonatus]